ncbi:uncharacterized protein LOC134812432 isoform X2 [Bolinopsis microptera]|uniref:uncharacterized protein LOC134812432 isoform X2 n=1 Tax=Bolinopsis microptera TaxID=2820187 RepID=UPI003079E3F0
MYRGPDCISQVYGTRLKPLQNDPLTARLFASGRKLLTPERSVGNGGILRDIRTAGSTRPEEEGVVFRRTSLNDKVVESWYSPELLPQSLNTSGMQDACTIDKLKQEIQRLQKTLSDKEDLVLATRRIASDKERRLKGELAEVTEKYGEVCSEKLSLEDQLILLRDSSVNKDEHNKLFTLYTKTEALVFELQSKLVNCAATVPLEEYRMLQRELEESTDEVLQYKDIAARKEKELEAVILSQTDRIQGLTSQHAKQLAEGHKMTKKEVTERDEKLKATQGTNYLRSRREIHSTSGTVKGAVKRTRTHGPGE